MRALPGCQSVVQFVQARLSLCEKLVNTQRSQDIFVNVLLRFGHFFFVILVVCLLV